MDNLNNNKYYQNFVGCYAKRFYSAFEKDSFAKIIDYKLEYENQIEYFLCEKDGHEFWWDVEDCVIIIDGTGKEDLTEQEVDALDIRVLPTNFYRYCGYNPYTGEDN